MIIAEIPLRSVVGNDVKLLLNIFFKRCFINVAIIIDHTFLFPLQVLFRLEFEFSPAMVLDHVRVDLEASRCDVL